jgi:kynurenine formamidase
METQPTMNAAGTKTLGRLSEGEFEALFNSTRNWGDFPADKLERGSLNYITDQQVRDSSALVKNGAVVSMALPWNTVPGPDNHKPALHYMTEIGDLGDQEPMCNKDFIGVDYHGKSVSHLDALTHIVFKDQMFGGKSERQQVSSEGSTWGTVDKLGPIVTRGILLDGPNFYGKKWIEPGSALTKSEILEMEKRFNFTIAQGDCVLYRSGHFARREELGVWDPSDFSAGFYLDTIDLFKERKVSVIGADGDSDARPSPVDDIHSPIHALALPGLGIPLLDNLQLEPLAKACEKNGRWEFLMIIAPLNIPGGTGSPVNPIAIF